MIGVRNSANGLPQGFLENWAETAFHSSKFLIGAQVPDIIGLRVEAGWSDILQWCGLQGLG
jgi:hypothetical protein